MKNDWLLMAAIRRLVPSIEPDVLDGLLLIRRTSATPTGKHLWDMIVEAAYQSDEHLISAISGAIEQIRLCFPLAGEHINGLETMISDDSLRDIVSLLSEIPPDDNLLLSIYEYSMSRRVWEASSQSGDFYTPRKITQYMAELLGAEKGGTVYDPCCGSGAMLCSAVLSRPDKDISLYGQTQDQQSLQICQMNLALRGLSADLGKGPANTLLEDLHAGRQFDYILANPPFNLSDWYEAGSAKRDARWQYGRPPQKNANFAWLQHIIWHLSPDGCAVTLLPNGTLTTQNHAECEIRRNILLDGWVEAIIALPAGLFYTTKIPCCIWIIKKSARNTVLFIDARGLNLHEQSDASRITDLLYRYRKGESIKRTEWYAAASHAEIAQRHFILSPNLYTNLKELPLPPAEQISEHFNLLADTLCGQMTDASLRARIQQWKADIAPTNWNSVFLTEAYDVFGGVSARKEAFGHGTPMADVRTVIHNLFLPDAFPARVEVPDADAPKYYIRRGDVLLNRTSETADELACCSVAARDYPAVYGAYLKRLRPQRGNLLDPLYMAGYFRSAIYRREVARVSFVYTTRANMNLHQLSMIRLYYPDMDWQRAIGEMLFSIACLKQAEQGIRSKELIDRFLEAFIQKFITYPISLFQKEHEQ